MTDAHNHLHQLPDPAAAIARARSAGVPQMAVNGTSENDWPAVARLATDSPAVIPCYGLHPWEVPHRSPQWREKLRDYLAKDSTAMVGECGLDRWKKPFDLPAQVSCLRAQIDLAIEFQRPLTIHCLQAWGPLLDLLKSSPPLPPFLLHAYSGSRDLVPVFADLGAYFSFSGYFLHERKSANREAFREVPPERLLLETDAPSMLPPADFIATPLPSEQNDVANLPLFLPPLAKLLGTPLASLRTTLQRNFETFSQTSSEP